MLDIRRERIEDVEAIYGLNSRAFGNDGEARLVNALREAGALTLSLVAVQDQKIVGHLALSPVTIRSEAGLIQQGLGLAPMAVLPEYQNQGIGSRLVEQSLKIADEEAAYPVMVVLGHPEFYPRFGFQPARPLGISSEYDVPADVFMVRELQAGALKNIRGLVQYHPVFALVS